VTMGLRCAGAAQLGGGVAADHEDERADLQEDALPGRIEAEPACAGLRSA
jgi:hypothetical protein